jgi:hypothetical protein
MDEAGLPKQEANVVDHLPDAESQEITREAGLDRCERQEVRSPVEPSCDEAAVSVAA